MKKLIYMMAGLAMTASLASCADTEKPVFHQPAPESFRVNAPALANEFLASTGDIDDKSTFNLVCNQPDYGFAAQANFNAQVSLTGEFKDAVTDEEGNVLDPATYVNLDNQDVHNANMSIRTYDLAVAMCTLAGIDSKETWDKYIEDGNAITGKTIYLRATCEIAGFPQSYIVSSNIVTYNNVSMAYAVPVAGIIYICGDLNGFKEPSAANADFYLDWQLVEVEIGSRIYGGTFNMPATESVHPGLADTDPNYNTQFRFFTELSGWGDGSKMVGSNEADFYVEPIGGQFSDGTKPGSLYSGNAVYGKGNWGIFLEKESTLTFAVDLVDKAKPKVKFIFGTYDVAIGKNSQGINEPIFVEPEE